MIVSTFHHPFNTIAIALSFWITASRVEVFSAEGVKVVSFYGYDDCLQLSNAMTTVILCPAAGGRVLQYAINDTNVLYLPPGDEGWQWQPGARNEPAHAGRFDVGPEKMIRHASVVWMGPWSATITGDRSVRLTSQVDETNGMQLDREFVLAPDSSHLKCQQTIHNVSDRMISRCHWSRTFAVGRGIAVVPRSDEGRFPHGYVLYEPGDKIQIKPNDPNVHLRDNAVIIAGPPQFPKLGFDSYAGWIAYYAPTNQLFIKRYHADRNRAYNEVAGLTASVWYPDREMVELEPIGPAENLAPGQSASFDEHWWLLETPFPNGADAIDVHDLESTIRSLASRDQ